MPIDVFVWHRGETKKATLETTALASLRTAVTGKFPQVSLEDADTVLYVDSQTRPGVTFELESESDLKDGCTVAVRSRRALQERASQETTTVARTAVATATAAPIAASTAEATTAVRAAQPAEHHHPILLPNGKVQIGSIVYQIPSGGLGGSPAAHHNASVAWRWLAGNPIVCVSPRTGLERTASFSQTLGKLVYGNPFKPARMTLVQEKEFLYEEFVKFDLDKDGGLSMFEFSLLAHALGREMFPIQVQLAFQLCDTDKNGKIDFEELCTWWLSEVRPVERTSAPRHVFGRARELDVHEERELCMRAFAQFDTDGNGSLDPEEFKMLTRLTGSNLSDDDVARLMATIDTDHNGVITFDEFFVWLVTSPHIDKNNVLEMVRRNVTKYSRSRWLDMFLGGSPLSSERQEARRRARVREMFEHFDTNKNGSLDLVELRELARHLGEPMGDDEARVVMNHIDTNKDGTIDFEEFYTWFTADEFRADRAHALVRRLQGFRLFAMLDGSDQRAAAAKAFARFDADGNGVLDAAEFKAMSLAMGLKLTDNEIKQQIASIDLNGNGEIDFDEFFAWWREERLNPPKGTQELKFALRAKRQWRSFLGLAQQHVDWSHVDPAAASAAAARDAAAAAAAAPGTTEATTSKKATKKSKPAAAAADADDDNDDVVPRAKAGASDKAESKGSKKADTKKASTPAKATSKKEDDDESSSYEYEYETSTETSTAEDAKVTKKDATKAKTDTTADRKETATTETGEKSASKTAKADAKPDAKSASKTADKKKKEESTDTDEYEYETETGTSESESDDSSSEEKKPTKKKAK